MKLKAKISLVLLILTVGIGIYFIFKSLASPKEFIPEEFSEAKNRGAEISQKIVNLSTASLEGLNKISEYDKAKNYPEAIIQVSKEIVQNRANREEAIKLASQLEKMASSLSKISPKKAQQIATEAVSYEVVLVSRLLSYNEYFNQLFDVLTKKFKYGTNNTNDKVQELINKINDETRAINELNMKFNNAIKKFEQVFQK
jgi:hypothetical protein